MMKKKTGRTASKIGLALLVAAPGSASAEVTPEEYAVARAEIVNLSNRLMIASDARDAETYAETFSKNGVLDWVNGIEHGREEIREAIAEWRKALAAPAADATSQARTRHYVLNHDITLAPDGKSGQGRVYWFALTNRTPQTDVQLLYFGHVIEEYVKEDGKWLFAKRTVFNESRHNRALFYPELGERDPRLPD
jgi:hypothetical protein